jgi:hypothetical protein
MGMGRRSAEQFAARTQAKVSGFALEAAAEGNGALNLPPHSNTVCVEPLRPKGRLKGEGCSGYA